MSLLLQTSVIPRPNIHLVPRTPAVKSLPLFVLSRKSDSDPDLKLNSTPKPKPKPKPKPRTSNRRRKTEPPQNDSENPTGKLPTTIPRKPRRGRRSEAAAVEDYVRESLERTFASIREQSEEVFENKGNVMKERAEDEDESESESESESSDDEEFDQVAGEEKKKKAMVVEEESRDWPLDADVGWGIRASEYFEKHPIKNVAGENGVEIDWEGEIDDSWVKEINCLEWESFAFHPSPLVVLVFERYNRATENWKALKELEKAVKVYWDAKDRLPPRSVKIDINIERDLAYALKVKECPQILFLLGNRILYREKEFRTADELVHMIAHFYYNAKRPSWIDVSALSRPYY